MKILVTGGTGFLGKSVVKELLKDSTNEVTILIRNISKKIYDLEYIVIDLCNLEKVLEKVKGFDVIYHFAGNVRTPDSDTLEHHYRGNVLTTFNLLQACHINKIKKFIFVSSGEVYGDFNNHLNNAIKEDGKKNPNNEYGKSKLLAEKCCEQFSKSSSVFVTIIRPSYIYGYGQNKNRLLPLLLKQALIDKKITLKPFFGGNDYIYIKDVTRGIILLGNKDSKKKIEYYNLGSGKFTSNDKVFGIISTLISNNKNNYVSEKTGPSQKEFWLDIDKAKKMGYHQEYTLKDGIKEMMDITKTKIAK
jgi:UDP-glucose 4-epimerase